MRIRLFRKPEFLPNYIAVNERQTPCLPGNTSPWKLRAGIKGNTKYYRHNNQLISKKLHLTKFYQNVQRKRYKRILPQNLQLCGAYGSGPQRSHSPHCSFQGYCIKSPRFSVSNARLNETNETLKKGCLKIPNGDVV